MWSEKKHDGTSTAGTAKRRRRMTAAAHPYADKFPMLPDSELAELAESVGVNLPCRRIVAEWLAC